VAQVLLYRLAVAPRHHFYHYIMLYRPAGSPSVDAGLFFGRLPNPLFHNGDISARELICLSRMCGAASPAWYAVGARLGSTSLLGS
jgi:hypothetical protein